MHKDSPESIYSSDVQIIHKFTGWVTPDLNFKVRIFFNFKYLENGTR